MTDSVSLKSKTLDALKRFIYVFLCCLVDVWSLVKSTPIHHFYNHESRGSAIFVFEVDGTWMDLSSFWTNTCHQWHLHISDFNIFQGTSLDVKNTAAIQQAKVDLMIAKLWKVSWSTSQCIFYVICSIEWSPRLVCTIFIHYPFSFCWETSHNIPQTNNMRQTNVTRLTKFEQLEIRNLFFSLKKPITHTSDGSFFRGNFAVKVILLDQLKWYWTTSCYHRLSGSWVPGPQQPHQPIISLQEQQFVAILPTCQQRKKCDTWYNFYHVIYSYHVIWCYLSIYFIIFLPMLVQFLLRSNINISQVALLPIHRPTTIQQHPPWKDDSCFRKKTPAPPNKKHI